MSKEGKTVFTKPETVLMGEGDSKEFSVMEVQEHGFKAFVE